MDFVTKNAKGKLKFTLEQAMKAQREVEVYSTPPLTSALAGSGWSTRRPGRFMSLLEMLMQLGQPNTKVIIPYITLSSVAPYCEV
jgi:hypothetical protein